MVSAHARTIQDQIKDLLMTMEDTAQRLHRQVGSISRTIRKHEARNVSTPLLRRRVNIQAVDQAAQLVTNLANETNAPTKEFLDEVQAKVYALINSSASQAIALKNEIGSGSDAQAQAAREQVDAQVSSWEADLQNELAGKIDSARSRAENISDEIDAQTGSNVSEAIENLADFYGDLQSSVSSFTGEFQDRAGSLRRDILEAGSSYGSQLLDSTSSWLSDVTSAASNVSASVGSDAIEEFVSNVTSTIKESFPSASNVSDAIQAAAESLTGRIRKAEKTAQDQTTPDDLFRVSQSGRVRVSVGISALSLAIVWML